MGVRSKISKGSIGPGTDKVTIKPKNFKKFSTKDHENETTTERKKRTIEDEYGVVDDKRFTDG